MTSLFTKERKSYSGAYCVIFYFNWEGGENERDDPGRCF